jgi:hypothetical protein
MLKDLRIAAGLGNPPSIFTTNSSESINAVVKRKVNFKETEWPQFNQELKELVNEMHEESIRALSGRGQYKLCKAYQHLLVHPSRWVKMTPEQRLEQVKRFQSAAVRPLPSAYQLQPSGSSSCASAKAKCVISVPAEESGIQSLAFETIHSIWVKVESYLKSEVDIVPAPGVNWLHRNHQ